MKKYIIISLIIISTLIYSNVYSQTPVAGIPWNISNQNGQNNVTEGQNLNDIGINAGKHINWGNILGDSGYGFRDNSGTIQWKNNGGSWADITAGSPSTPDKSVQFDNSGVFGGSSNFTFDTTVSPNLVTLTGSFLNIGHTSIGANAPASNNFILYVSEVVTDNTYHAALDATLTVNPTTGNANPYYGAAIGNVSSGTGNFSNTFWGIFGNVTHNSTGTLANMIGAEIQLVKGGSAGTITNATALMIDSTSGIATNTYNIWSKGSSSLNKFEGKIWSLGHAAIGAQSSIQPNEIVDITETFTDLTTAIIQSATVNTTLLSSSTPPTQDAFGFVSNTIISHSDNKDWTGRTIYGIKSIADIQGGSAGGSAIGIQSIVGADSISTTENITALQSIVIISSTNSKAIGLEITTPSLFGTTTNNYGIYINDQSGIGGTISENIHSAGSTSLNFFEGSIGILPVGSTILGRLHLETTKTGSGTDNPKEYYEQADITTTDDTITTLQTITLSDNNIYLIEARVIYRCTGGIGGNDGSVGSSVIRGTFKRFGGGAIQVATTTIDQKSDIPAWDVEFDTSTNDILVTVTGQATDNITWHTTTIIQNLSS